MAICEPTYVFFWLEYNMKASVWWCFNMFQPSWGKLDEPITMDRSGRIRGIPMACCCIDPQKRGVHIWTNHQQASIWGVPKIEGTPNHLLFLGGFNIFSTIFHHKLSSYWDTPMTTPKLWWSLEPQVSIAWLCNSKVLNCRESCRWLW